MSQGGDATLAEHAFIWPPVPDADRPIHADEPRDLREAQTLLAEARRGSGAPMPTIGARGAWRRSWSLLGDLEADLLGVRSISFRRWADATGWARDGTDAYCWRCAGSVGPYETDGDGCAGCRAKPLAWSRAIRLGTYEGGLRAAILELKFGRWRRSGQEIGREIGQALAAQLASGGVAPEEALLVPVPMSWRRRMGQGVDHTQVIAAAASKASGVRCWRALGRVHRRPQVGLSATARAANVRGAFTPARGGAGWGRMSVRDGGKARVLVVIDDVRTTGATMTAACRAVRGLIGKGPILWSCVGCVATDRRSGGASDASSGAEGEKFDKTFGVGS